MNRWQARLVQLRSGVQNVQNVQNAPSGPVSDILDKLDTNSESIDPAKGSAPKGLHHVNARGKKYVYFQPGRGTKAQGERVRLPSVDSPEFESALRKAQAAAQPLRADRRPLDQTDIDAEINRLASLPAAIYKREHDGAARRLGQTPAMLDSMVKRERELIAAGLRAKA